MFLLPLREVDVLGLFVTPAALALLLAVAMFLVVHWAAGYVDLNRYVWNRPLFQVALFVVLFAAAVLTLRR